ncbi:hypothetical protein PQO03_07135 [Lentisphaera profundi]|uniref:AsmA domain-containing protein n=1 Tax=Lentisphaera profundi TaxID=1658616 RepID=A0ABY7VN29_9BACT|nr:hypothetical protein [Lentisphaera profundi]WDE95490.1 hypothetical protein PQO03_07135 [Lentisphaera profundi]
MNKKYSFIIIIFLATIISVLIALSSMGFIIKKTINQVTHNITGTDVELSKSSFSLLTGKATMQKLLIANPKGSSTPLAMIMTSAKMKINPMSITKDTVIIENLETDNLEIFWIGKEGKNFREIEAHIIKFATRERAIIEDITSRGLEDEHKYFALQQMTLTNTKVHYYQDSKKINEIIIPEITLSNIGDTKIGASFVDLMEKSFKEIIVSCEKHVNAHIISTNKK